MSGIKISDTHMSSPATPHTATATEQGWQVSWLPGRVLDRNQATTAMVIANIAASRNLTPGDKLWPHLDNWASELGLSGPDAVVRASEPPATTAQSHTTPRQAAAQPPFGGARLCAHADRDGQGAHWLPPGQTCHQPEPSQEPEAGA